MSGNGSFRASHHSVAEDAEKYRLAQANRIRRYCNDNGLDVEAVMAGELGDDVLAPICDDNGKVVPEAQDIDAVS